MRTPPSNTPSARASSRGRSAAALLAGVCLLACVCSCADGGARGGEGAQALVRDTFNAHAPIGSAHVQMSLSLVPAAGRSRGAFALSLQGAFQAAASGRLRSFAIAIALSAGGGEGRAPRLRLALEVTDRAGRLELELGHTSYAAPATALRALQQGYASALGGFATVSPRSTSASSASAASLAVQPAAWIVAPQLVGRSSLAGVGIERISAHLESARFLTGVSRLAALLRTLALAAAGPASAAQIAPALAPGALEALAGSLRSARVELYTGARDHILRRLQASALIAAPAPAARGVASAPRPGHLEFVLALSDVNAPQRPAGA